MSKRRMHCLVHLRNITYFCTVLVGLGGVLALVFMGIRMNIYPNSAQTQFDYLLKIGNALDAVRDETRQITGLLIPNGLICMAMGIVGILAIHRDHRVLMVAFLFLIVASMLMTVGSAYLSITLWLSLTRERFESTAMDKLLRNADDGSYSGVRNGFGTLWDTVQASTKCCGMQSYLDYRKSWWFQITNPPLGYCVPLSCCALEVVDAETVVKNVGACQQAACTNKTIEEQDPGVISARGCFDVVYEQFRGDVLCLVAKMATIITCVVVSLKFCLLLPLSVAYFLRMDELEQLVSRPAVDPVQYTKRPAWQRAREETIEIGKDKPPGGGAAHVTRISQGGSYSSRSGDSIVPYEERVIIGRPASVSVRLPPTGIYAQIGAVSTQLKDNSNPHAMEAAYDFRESTNSMDTRETQIEAVRYSPHHSADYNNTTGHQTVREEAAGVENDAYAYDSDLEDYDRASGWSNAREHHPGDDIRSDHNEREFRNEHNDQYYNDDDDDLYIPDESLYERVPAPGSRPAQVGNNS